MPCANTSHDHECLQRPERAAASFVQVLSTTTFVRDRKTSLSSLDDRPQRPSIARGQGTFGSGFVPNLSLLAPAMIRAAAPRLCVSELVSKLEPGGILS